MKLLIITQKVDENDDILGFFHGWLEKFSKNAEKIFVISQFVGGYNLPENAEVFSLGKEKGYSKIRQLFNFYGLLFKNLPKVDTVFVHMIPLWVVSGAPLFKIYRKKVYLWYVHKSVNFTLKLAEKLVFRIFTASPESCRLKSEKIVITGHGIDVEKFKKAHLETEFPSGNSVSKFRIISAGRIASVKNYELLVEAAEILRNKDFNFEIRIAGGPVIENDKVYLQKLKNLVKNKRLEDKIFFASAIPYRNIAEFYQGGDLFVNFSDTGSLDKAVLEAMASGLLVLTSNEAFKNILPDNYFVSKKPEEISGKIIALSKADFDPTLRDYVVKNHGLRQLIVKLISLMQVLK